VTTNFTDGGHVALPIVLREHATRCACISIQPAPSLTSAVHLASSTHTHTHTHTHTPLTATATSPWQESGLPTVSFPTDGEFVAGWAPPTGAAPEAFEVQLASESGSFPPQLPQHQQQSKGLGVLPWTSGKINSNQSSFEFPAAAVSLLSERKTYVFRVRVWAAGAAGDWSSPAAFDTAPSDAAWTEASWIGGGSELGANWTLSSAPVRARAYVSGLGLAELWINGAKVRRVGCANHSTRDPFAPPPPPTHIHRTHHHPPPPTTCTQRLPYTRTHRV
jgi:hypothetical protein